MRKGLLKQTQAKCKLFVMLNCTNQLFTFNQITSREYHALCAAVYYIFSSNISLEYNVFASLTWL